MGMRQRSTNLSKWIYFPESNGFDQPSAIHRRFEIAERWTVSCLYYPACRAPRLIFSSSGSLQLVSGIDLTSSVDDVISSMKSKINGVDGVTHVIFTAYIEKPDFETLRKVNTDLLNVAVSAIDQLAPDLQSVVLQTGGKAYGVEFSDKLEINPPLKVRIACVILISPLYRSTEMKTAAN